MELTRADNLLKHDKEIHSRRKRTWFQTEREEGGSSKGVCFEEGEEGLI